MGIVFVRKRCTGSVKVYEPVGRFEELGMERGELEGQPGGEA